MPGKDEPQPWSHRKTGPIYRTSTPDAVAVYYRTDHCDMVSELCLGERYAHPDFGWCFDHEVWRGSYSNNWHGGPTGSLHELLVWVAEAEHARYGPELWMKGEVIDRG